MILIIGSGAREHAIAKALAKDSQIACFASSNNPGITPLCQAYEVGDITNSQAILDFCKANTIEFAIIGPEAPLEKGVADALWKNNIPVIGPKKTLARIETSKGFTRDLFEKYQLPGGPRYQRFTNLQGVNDFLNELGSDYVIKADGLMGGKGVKVSGEHLQNHEEAFHYCQSLIDKGHSFIIEEKFVGQEFSLLSFSDGVHLAHMPAVQDHKRAFENDLGPNTGGMGSYSDADHSLPFLTNTDIQTAQKLNEQTIQALKQECDEHYIGILYGGFMATKDGVKLIEYNARLGDPEALNLLSLLKTSLTDIFRAMIAGNLSQPQVQFLKKASVCKYAVPNGYPDNPVKNEIIDISAVTNKQALFFGAVEQQGKQLLETGSRTIGVVALADSISEAESMVEADIHSIKGPLFHRKDIGTAALIEKRIQHMQHIRERQ